jgi:hypothetical protein
MAFLVVLKRLHDMTLACVMRKLMLVAAEALNEVTGAHKGEVAMKSIMRMSSLQEVPLRRDSENVSY